MQLRPVALCFLIVTTFATLHAQRPSTALPELKPDLHWRMIGPFRGGRTRAATGVIGQPNVFYMGQVDGGVWKSDDYGRTWNPIFDGQPSQSIGAIAVAASDSNTVYVASGEGLRRPDLSVGDGIYKSIDAGKTWQHLGLRDGQQIPALAVDPRDSNKLFAAVLGHPYGANEERGIFRSIDGGQSWKPVLSIDQNTGGSDVKIDPSNPNVVYASMWESRLGPWEDGNSYEGTHGGLFKSTDGGETWHKLTKGLPDKLMQIYVAIAASEPNRLYATLATTAQGGYGSGAGLGVYRSDDAGESWYKVTDDPRPAMKIGGGDLPVPAVDPKDPNTVYSASIVTVRSTDGGKTWISLRGAPGGDDYQNLWINPENPNIILLVSDQGALVSVNKGESWSSWYNQPTAQLYHVAVTNSFPYQVCAGQQESGSVCISSRGNDGEITFRDWHPVAAEEYGYVVPDPLDPDIVYGGKLTRYDRRTAQAQNIVPMPLGAPDFRVIRTEPIAFSPFDPHLMYFAANTLWATSDAGQSWKQVSPDLTRKTFQLPATVGIYSSEPAAQPKQRGVIYALALSEVDRNLMWAGTDDGLIWLTTDGGANWNNVTPPQLSPWQKVSVLEASHTDANEAYAAINTLRLDDLRPHLYRTRDAGKTWTEIVEGIPANENTNSVREDPRRKGLLFAGTERAVYLSFDDGGHWQSLRLNMPATSVRDLLIKGSDLAVATHGRGFWILDDITPLRQLEARILAEDAFLFAPEPALRIHSNLNTDTPLPPDYPAGQNPPDGAIFNYYLKSPASGPITLEIRNSLGRLFRRVSSADPLPASDPELAIPSYWLRPQQPLSAAAGFHRFIFDLHLAPVPGIKPEYPIAAVPGNTAPQPTSPWIMPGRYSLILTVEGRRYAVPLRIEMDPRVKTSLADLQKQFDASFEVYQDLLALQPVVLKANAAREQLKEMRGNASGALAAKLDEVSKKLDEVAGGEGRRRRGPHTDSLSGVRDSLLQMLTMLQEVDLAPTTQAAQALPKLHEATASLLEQWKQFEGEELAPLKLQP